MPYKNPQSPEARASQKRRDARHYQKHKERINKEQREKTKTPEYKKWHKDYNERDYVKQYTTIKNWKRIGIKSDNYEDLYLLYVSMNYCMLCGDTITKRINKHLDHCHKSGEVRFILCRSCNLRY